MTLWLHAASSSMKCAILWISYLTSLRGKTRCRLSENLLDTAVQDQCKGFGVVGQALSTCQQVDRSLWGFYAGSEGNYIYPSPTLPTAHCTSSVRRNRTAPGIQSKPSNTKHRPDSPEHSADSRAYSTQHTAPETSCTQSPSIGHTGKHTPQYSTTRSIQNTTHSTHQTTPETSCTQSPSIGHTGKHTPQYSTSCNIQHTAHSTHQTTPETSCTQLPSTGHTWTYTAQYTTTHSSQHTTHSTQHTAHSRQHRKQATHNHLA